VEIMFPGYSLLAEGDPAMWLVLFGCVGILVIIFAAVTIGKAAVQRSDRRRAEAYLHAEPTRTPSRP
jgi:hypothetical protein